MHGDGGCPSLHTYWTISAYCCHALGHTLLPWRNPCPLAVQMLSNTLGGYSWVHTKCFQNFLNTYFSLGVFPPKWKNSHICRRCYFNNTVSEATVIVYRDGLPERITSSKICFWGDGLCFASPPSHQCAHRASCQDDPILCWRESEF